MLAPIFRRTIAGVAASVLMLGAACSSSVVIPDASTMPAAPATPDEIRIQDQEVCVGSTVESAGRLGNALFYRSERLPTGELAVGYYAFFTEERPWGNNWETWLVLPALFTDLVYTRALLVAPGLQRLAYGKGDVEGFRVVYADEQGALRPEYAIADDGGHVERRLSVADLFSIDPKRLTLYTNGWSHHLAAVGTHGSADLAYRTCYGPRQIRPLTAEIARDFHLDRRARPAAVGSLPELVDRSAAKGLARVSP